MYKRFVVAVLRRARAGGYALGYVRSMLGFSAMVTFSGKARCKLAGDYGVQWVRSGDHAFECGWLDIGAAREGEIHGFACQPHNQKPLHVLYGRAVLSIYSVMWLTAHHG